MKRHEVTAIKLSPLRGYPHEAPHRVDTIRHKKRPLATEKGFGQPPGLSFLPRGVLVTMMVGALAVDVQVHRHGVPPHIACPPLPCAVGCEGRGGRGRRGVGCTRGDPCNRHWPSTLHPYNAGAWPTQAVLQWDNTRSAIIVIITLLDRARYICSKFIEHPAQQNASRPVGVTMTMLHKVPQGNSFSVLTHSQRRVIHTAHNDNRAILRAQLSMVLPEDDHPPCGGGWLVSARRCTSLYPRC